jgi:hypothetical protein
MILWIHWWNVVRELRPACSRTRSFLWLAACLAGFCIRSDLLGVSSFIRALGLREECYNRLLDFFHSKAVDTDRLAQVWVKIVLRTFKERLCVNGCLVILIDGIKVMKSGKKMPAVKSLHQESDNNNKAQYIMGHSCQAASLVVGAEKSSFAVPLCTRIHEGLVFSNRCRQKVTDRMVAMIEMIAVAQPFYCVGDAYYACHSIVFGILKVGGHLVTRVKRNAVAYTVAPRVRKKRRGRPKFYGRKIKLWSLFDHPEKMMSAESPVYGETGVTLGYRSLDLIWKPLGLVVRFVAVTHPTRGFCLLMCTDLTLHPIDIIRLYGIRFKIEVSFKSAIRIVGAYAYHFWMSAMTPIKRRSGNQYLHRKSEKYRELVRRKLDAFHRHIQIGIIALGLLQYLSATFPALVWKSFGSWIRTIRPGVPPSEMVAAQALRATLPEFLRGNLNTSPLIKFILERVDTGRTEGLRLTG